MNEDDSLLATLLLKKRELLRLVVMAAMLAFAVGVLASATVAQEYIPLRTVCLLAGGLIAVCLIWLGTDLRNGLFFEDHLVGVILVDPTRNDILSIRGYDLSEDVVKILRAVKAESRAIFRDWEIEPLIAPSEKVDTPSEGSEKIDQPSKSDKPRYIALYKVKAPAPKNSPSTSARLLEEVLIFGLLEELSVHLSTYFNNWNDDYVVEYHREDIPEFLLRNRVLNLLCTPIEHRDIFLDAFPGKADKPDGELHALYGSDGSMFSRFDLVLPKGTQISRGSDGAVIINTKRLTLELSAKYTEFSIGLEPAFLHRYVKCDPKSVKPRQIHIARRGRTKPLALLSPSGWQYYRWLDSFRKQLKRKYDFESFKASIHWDMIEPLLYAQMARSTPTKTKDSPSEDHPGSSPEKNT